MKFSHRRRLRSGGLGLVFCMASLSPAGAQSLSEALADAYATNPTLSAARVELRVVNEGVPQALANWRPSVSVTGSAGKARVDSKTNTTSNDETLTPLEASASIVQPLYRGGRTIAATSRAEQEVQDATGPGDIAGENGPPL